jgi:hypothetical protein
MECRKSKPASNALLALAKENPVIGTELGGRGLRVKAESIDRAKRCEQLSGAQRIPGMKLRQTLPRMNYGSLRIYKLKWLYESF